jgi:translation initiation factor 2-alpha kinase 3
MAPEVISGANYSSKVDIFSLGVIIVELWVAFSTGHERIITLMDCKKGKVPHALAQEHPSVARLALACLQSSPDDRPSAMEVCPPDGGHSFA